MLLTIAAFLSALGFAGWIAGSVFQYPEVALLGAILVLGTGAWIMVDDLEVRDGRVETNVSANETRITRTYEPVSSPVSNFSVGVMTTLFGGVLGLRSVKTLSD